MIMNDIQITNNDEALIIDGVAHEIKTITSPEKLANWINSIEGIEGITFSGGEPFEQAEAIVKVIEKVNSQREEKLSIFIFTGFNFDFLKGSRISAVQQLLSLTDMLSAGPYISSKKDNNLLWRGSSNQKLIYLSKRYSPLNELNWLKESPVEELIMTGEKIKRTGFFGKKGLLYDLVINKS